MSHAIGFAVTLAASTNLTQYVGWKAQTRRGSHWNRWGPTYLLLLSVPLTAADYIRHIILDADLSIGKHMGMYRPGCPKHEGFGAITCLSLVGFFVTILSTYLGFACMIIGTLWAADLGTKIRLMWKRIRASSQRRAENGCQETLGGCDQQPTSV